MSIILRSIALEPLVGVLLKALGDPDEMFWWDKRYGGSHPTPQQSGTYAQGGGGNQEIFDWLNANQGKWRDWLRDDDGKPRLVDYPLEGREIAPWSEVARDLNLPATKQGARDAFSRFTTTEAMPGIGIMDFPPEACIYATRNDPDSACGHCYACENRYPMNNVQNNLWARIDQALGDSDPFMSGMQEVLYNDASQNISRRESASGVPVRVFTAGDARGPGSYSQVSDLAAQALPHENMRFWMATRQLPFLEQFLDARGWEDDAFPSNVNVRISLPGRETMDTLSPDAEYAGTNIADLLRHPRISASTYDAVGRNSVVCPKTLRGTKSNCNSNIDPRTGDLGCRACWDPTVTIAYLHHDKNGKRQLTEDEMERAMQLQFGPNWAGTKA